MLSQSDYRKFQNQLFNSARHLDRIDSSHNEIRQISTQDQVDTFLSLISNPDTIIQGIQGLSNLCDEKRVVLLPRQAPIFISIFENVTDESILCSALSLIERILRFHEPVSSDTCATYLVKILFKNYNNIDSIHSLFHIVYKDECEIDSSIACASSVMNEIKEGVFCTVESLLAPDSPTLELNIHFLSSFAVYDDPNLTEFSLSLLDSIFQLSNSGIRPSVRRACLHFLKRALQNPSLAEKVAFHEQFVTLFQTPPHDLRERNLVLLILNMACTKTFNPLKMIELVLNELLPFVMQGLKILANPIEDELLMSFEDNPDMESKTENEKQRFVLDLSSAIVCYSIDIIKAISNGGIEPTQTLYSLDIVNLIWQLFNEKRQYNIIVSSLSTLMVIFMNSNDEQRQLFITSNFFDELGNLYSSIPDENEMEITDLLFQLIEECVIKKNENLVQHLFSTQSLMESLSEVEQLSEDNSELYTKIHRILQLSHGEEETQMNPTTSNI